MAISSNPRALRSGGALAVAGLLLAGVPTITVAAPTQSSRVAIPTNGVVRASLPVPVGLYTGVVNGSVTKTSTLRGDNPGVGPYVTTTTWTMSTRLTVSARYDARGRWVESGSRYTWAFSKTSRSVQTVDGVGDCVSTVTATASGAGPFQRGDGPPYLAPTPITGRGGLTLVGLALGGVAPAMVTETTVDDQCGQGTRTTTADVPVQGLLGLDPGLCRSPRDTLPDLSDPAVGRQVAVEGAPHPMRLFGRWVPRLGGFDFGCSRTRSWSDPGDPRTDVTVTMSSGGTVTAPDPTPPIAVPGPYRAVLRGARVLLDGSRSRARVGRLVAYRWTFAPGPGCPSGTTLRSASRTTVRAAVTLLCGLRVTLQVTDSRGRSASASTVVRVVARRGAAWTTPFTHRETLATPSRGPTAPPDAEPDGQGNYRLDFTGGVNTTDCGEEAPGSKILCPTVGGPTGSWRGKGYTLARVRDPGGPFHNFWWVTSSSLTVKRVALINPTITPGVRMYPNRGSWYDENVARGHPAAAFLAAVKAHEGYGKPGVKRSGHTQIIRDLIRGSQNPRVAIEPLFGATEADAVRAADDRLHKVDQKVDVASNDPLTRIWSGGPFAIWSERAGIWVETPSLSVP